MNNSSFSVTLKGHTGGVIFLKNISSINIILMYDTPSSSKMHMFET